MGIVATLTDLFRAAELLNSLPEQENAESDHDAPMLNADAPTSSYRIFSTSYNDPEEAVLEAKEAPKYLLAKSFFDTKEYDRCAAVFLPLPIPAGGLAVYEKSKGRTPLNTPLKAKGKGRSGRDAPQSPYPKLSQKSLFLALYARYIAGEKRKDEESEMVLGPADGGQTTNRELPTLARGLEAYFHYQESLGFYEKKSQGWLEYLYGVVLVKTKQEALAQQWLHRAVLQNPYHWGAWEELTSLLSSIDDLYFHVDPSRLPQTVMSLLYRTHASVDLFSTADSTNTFNQLHSLLTYFPTSPFLLTQLALSHYHAKDYEQSAAIFQKILTSHPHRLDALDHYSNILYVMNDRPKLAFLAHLATSVDKFRPETCCVVGNYYSLCSQHEKAVMYFRRALTLDRSFLSAWTLMGHEYIELKNTHAAIESYRRAVDVNRKDYRAWYGLGQAYEVLDMGFYALFYYQRAAGLRPYDPKMWAAVGACYAKMERLDQAVRALKRALVAGTYYETETPQQSFSTNLTASQRSQKPKHTGRKLLDPETLFQIASLHERLGEEDECERYMDLCIKQELGTTGKIVSDAAKERQRKMRRERRAAERRAERSQVDNGEQDIDFPDGDTEVLSSSDDQTEDMDEFEENDGFGTGTTATTSKARLWLARYWWRHGDLDKAESLAEELCMDGYEVEEAKGLVREIRGRREGMGGSKGNPSPAKDAGTFSS
jgi:anaphase-promoting complex subunit 8